MTQRRDTTGRGEGGSFRPSAKTIVAIVVIVLLIVLVVMNSEPTTVHLIFTTVTLQLWVLLTIVIVLSVGVGYMLGSQRTKARK